MKLTLGQTKEQTPSDLHGFFDLYTIMQTAILHEFYDVQIGFTANSDDTKPFGWIIHLEPVMYEGTYAAEIQYPSSEVYGLSLPDSTEEILAWIKSHPKEGLPGVSVDLKLLETVQLGWRYERKLFDDRKRFPEIEMPVTHSHRISALNFFYNEPDHPDHRDNEHSKLNTTYTFFTEGNKLREHALHEAENVSREYAEQAIWQPAPWFTGMTTIGYEYFDDTGL